MRELQCRYASAKLSGVLVLECETGGYQDIWFRIDLIIERGFNRLNDDGWALFPIHDVQVFVRTKVEFLNWKVCARITAGDPSDHIGVV